MSKLKINIILIITLIMSSCNSNNNTKNAKSIDLLNGIIKKVETKINFENLSKKIPNIDNNNWPNEFNQNNKKIFEEKLKELNEKEFKEFFKFILRKTYKTKKIPLSPQLQKIFEIVSYRKIIEKNNLLQSGIGTIGNSKSNKIDDRNI